jgi:methyl-accepting chemotaxis protein
LTLGGHAAILVGMEDERPKVGDLLNAWRDAARAAELADRLSQIAAEAAEQADRTAAASEEIAEMAETAAVAAERAASTARIAAKRAAELAADHRSRRLTDAMDAVTEARHAESAAAEAYHEAEHRARDRHGDAERFG